MNVSDNGYRDRVEAALKRLAAGGIVIVTDDSSRENEGDLVAASDAVTPETVNFMATHARGLICQSISAEQAARLELAPMTTTPTDPKGTAFTVSVDHESSDTGISAYERARTIRAVCDPRTRPSELTRPGHIFPLLTAPGGVLARRGHTEATADLARLAGFTPSGIMCEIMGEDGTMARAAELSAFAERHDLPLLSVDDIVRYRDAVADIALTFHSESSLPTAHGDFWIASYSSEDPAASGIVVLESAGGGYAAEATDSGRSVGPDSTGPDSTGPDSAEAEEPAARRDGIPVVRIHSECLTGEAFASARCDCGPQLETALARIGREGGALVYLRQEGRGIGLAEKIRAYALQDEGLDTVEANLALGHQADGRRFGAAAAVLKQRGYRRVRLLTNNPAKASALTAAGIEVVAREDLSVGITHSNRAYLRTKALKFGHILQGVHE
ncbi:MAG: 3,4-dihydroxy-2-butanone-4-phosphate synthase [Spirochaetaceae bacterium]